MSIPLDFSIEYSDEDGRTPIMLAAMMNKHTKLDILLDTYIGLFLYQLEL